MTDEPLFFRKEKYHQFSELKEIVNIFNIRTPNQNEVKKRMLKLETLEREKLDYTCIF